MTENGVRAGRQLLHRREVPVHAGRRRAAGQPGGWVSGRYDRRWNATRAQLAAHPVALGGEFILLPHDLWGADGVPDLPLPGRQRQLDRLRQLPHPAHQRRPGDRASPVQWDIWNEPNITLFWNRPQAQYFELWRRTYQRIRAAFPSHLIVGPSCACVPSTGGWWTQYLDFVSANNVVPDIISWHSPARRPGRQRRDGQHHARLARHPAPAAVPDQRVRRVATSRTRVTAPGTSPGWNGPAPTGCAPTGPAAATCTTTWATCSPATRPASTCPRANGGSTASTAHRPARSRRSRPAPTTTPSPPRTPASAKILVGGGRTTGNIAVNLQRLDTTSGIVQNNQVRVVVQRIPYNGGGAVPGTGHRPGHGRDPVQQRHDGQPAALQRRRHIHHHPAAAVGRRWRRVPVRRRRTALAAVPGQPQPEHRRRQPSSSSTPAMAATSSCGTSVRSPESPTPTPSSTSRAASAWTSTAYPPPTAPPFIQWTCNGGTNQQFTLRKVTYAGNDPRDYQLVARHSGKCVDVSKSPPHPGRWSTSGPAIQSAKTAR